MLLVRLLIILRLGDNTIFFMLRTAKSHSEHIYSKTIISCVGEGNYSFYCKMGTALTHSEQIPYRTMISCVGEVNYSRYFVLRNVFTRSEHIKKRTIISGVREVDLSLYYMLRTAMTRYEHICSRLLVVARKKVIEPFITCFEMRQLIPKTSVEELVSLTRKTFRRAPCRLVDIQKMMLSK